jgi:hypothetical protein
MITQSTCARSPGPIVFLTALGSMRGHETGEVMRAVRGVRDQRAWDDVGDVR